MLEKRVSLLLVHLIKIIGMSFKEIVQLVSKATGLHISVSKDF